MRIVGKILDSENHMDYCPGTQYCLEADQMFPLEDPELLDKDEIKNGECWRIFAIQYDRIFAYIAKDDGALLTASEANDLVSKLAKETVIDLSSYNLAFIHLIEEDEDDDWFPEEELDPGEEKECWLPEDDDFFRNDELGPVDE